MSLFRGARERRAVTASDLLAEMGRRRTGGGGYVTQDDAQRLSAVHAAGELVASTAASLPVDVVDGPPSPLFTNPSDEVHLQGWLHQLYISAVYRGNGYARVRDADRMGYPTKADTIHPDTVRWQYRKGDGWTVKVDGEPVDPWPLGDLLHVPLFLHPGCPVGLNPIEYFRATLGVPVLAQKFGRDFFEAGGHPVGIVTLTGADPGDDASKRTKAKFKQAAADRDVVVMSDVAKYEKLSVNPSDSQFLETMRFGVEEVARIFLGGFPEMIGGATSGQNVTYANREQKVADFLAFSLQSRYLVPFEHAFSRWLPRGRARSNVNALLRADLEARYKSYLVAAQIGTQSGTPLLTTNEMRELEDRDPIPGGDTFAPPRPPTAPRPDPAREDI